MAVVCDIFVSMYQGLFGTQKRFGSNLLMADCFDASKYVGYVGHQDKENIKRIIF